MHTILNKLLLRRRVDSIWNLLGNLRVVCSVVARVQQKEYAIFPSVGCHRVEVLLWLSNNERTWRE
jgi:hypothetical protein